MTHQEKIDEYYASIGEETIKIYPSAKFVIIPPNSKDKGYFRETIGRQSKYKMRASGDN